MNKKTGYDSLGREDFFSENSILKSVNPDIQRKLSVWERVSNLDDIRKLTVLLFLIVIWEIYSRVGGISALMLPSFSSTSVALVKAFLVEGLLINIYNSLYLLVFAYLIGICIAFLLVTLGVWTSFGGEILTTLTAMLNPLPAIALLPMAMLWFGLGQNAIIFILLHSIIWPVALNAHSGFLSVSKTLRMVGTNYGLSRLGGIFKILIPAAFPAILTGLRIGWAFAWRTLIAAEFVFGGQVTATSGQLGSEGSNSGGLGWMIFSNQMENQTAFVFAGMFVVIVIGIIVENGLFRSIERYTVNRWGMQVS